jgi:hypothetical protein
MASISVESQIVLRDPGLLGLTSDRQRRAWVGAYSQQR